MAPGDVILLVDLGTQSLRGTVMDRAGHKLARWSVPVTTIRAGTCAEQDAREWRDGLRTLLEWLGRDHQLARCLRAIAACGTLAGTVALDERGEPLRPAMLYSDARPARCLPEIEATAAFQVVSQATGWRANACDLLPQVLWLAREEPDTYARARLLLDSTGYLNYLLTGAAWMDTYTQFTCYADPFSGELPRPLLAELGLDAGKLGQPAVIGSVLGTLAPQLAAACGLPPCHIISLSYDSMTAYLGAGLHREGEALDISGTVTSFGVRRATQFLDGNRRVYSLPFSGSGDWLVRGSTAASGASLEWARAELMDCDFARFDEMVRSSPPGARGLVFLPYLAGERAPLCNPDARGAFFGFTASTTRSDMARAVYEGVCFSLRHIQSVMESGGVRIGTVKLAGGLAQNPLLNAIKADITGKTLVPLLDHELTTSGAAAIVGRALGWYESDAEAACVLGQGGAPVLPDAANKAVYDRQFQLYTMLAEQLTPLFLPSEAYPVAPLPPVESPIQIG
ncbi:xylulokinase [Paludibaculum fermentans]|uniref:Carbohydrate kinase n=1 Tax=Paludibaculum fermentans TaxID=1473598 RepID=A0A7S7NV18_PALFE|nr:FGGY-family carbohydrate kinase [Paludibaculum fermentans]QOY90333.1 hypothetical protein IRI77_10365 [Paludibaculum fermentans]